MRRLFAGSGVRLSFSHEIVRYPLRGAAVLAEPLEHHAGVVGPLIALRRAAERRGSWPAVQAEVAARCAADGERAAGSGYPAALTAGAISRPARVLGAADAYQAMREPRAHRPELSRDEAAAQLRADVTAGIRDAEAVDAVLAAAGHRVSRRREGPAGLTPREVEVLKLLAQGPLNKEIAPRGISREPGRGRSRQGRDEGESWAVGRRVRSAVPVNRVATICETFATECLGRPVRPAGSATLPVRRERWMDQRTTERNGLF